MTLFVQDCKIRSPPRLKLASLVLTHQVGDVLGDTLDGFREIAAGECNSIPYALVQCATAANQRVGAFDRDSIALLELAAGYLSVSRVYTIW